MILPIDLNIKGWKYYYIMKVHFMTVHRYVSAIEKDILSFLNSVPRGVDVTTNQVAKHVKTGWNTVERHLNRLEKMGKVHVQKIGKMKIWRLK